MSRTERLGSLYLAVQSVGALLWWAMLLTVPASRRLFMAADAPDVTLLAFAAADALLYIGAGAGSAYAIATRRGWAWPCLCLHAGAAIYAGLYCWGLTVLTAGDGWLGAAMMTPSMIVPGWLAWSLKPRGLPC